MVESFLRCLLLELGARGILDGVSILEGTSASLVGVHGRFVEDALLLRDFLFENFIFSVLSGTISLRIKREGRRGLLGVTVFSGETDKAGVVVAEAVEGAELGGDGAMLMGVTSSDRFFIIFIMVLLGDAKLSFVCGGTDFSLFPSLISEDCVVEFDIVSEVGWKIVGDSGGDALKGLRVSGEAGRSGHSSSIASRVVETDELLTGVG
jgi:hypothetical protein